MPTFPYLHKEAFKADFEEAWKDGALYNGQTSRVGFETPFQVYENLKQNTLGMMVMGNFQFTSETTKLQNFGVSSETPANAMWEFLSRQLLSKMPRKSFVEEHNAELSKSTRHHDAISDDMQNCTIPR